MPEFIGIVNSVKIIKCLKGGMPDMSGGSADNIFPPVDVFFREGVMRIFADLPGVNSDDISIYIYEGYIVIEGVKVPKPAERGYSFLRLERFKSSFRRIFKLPFTVLRYEASLSDGVLSIILTDN